MHTFGAAPAADQRTRQLSPLFRMTTMRGGKRGPAVGAAFQDTLPPDPRSASDLQILAPRLIYMPTGIARHRSGAAVRGRHRPLDLLSTCNDVAAVAFHAFHGGDGAHATRDADRLAIVLPLLPLGILPRNVAAVICGNHLHPDVAWLVCCMFDNLCISFGTDPQRTFQTSITGVRWPTAIGLHIAT